MHKIPEYTPETPEEAREILREAKDDVILNLYKIFTNNTPNAKTRNNTWDNRSSNKR